MSKKLFLLFFIFFVFFITFVYAEKNKTLNLGEIVVTPVMSQRMYEDLSSSVSIIKGKDIEESSVNTVTGILGNLPGVFVHKTGQYGRADVAIRGLGSRGRRVMVLVNGKPEKMGLFGCTITNSLPADNIERIELVRGSASLLYGSDALGGVVNIITKKPREKNEGDLRVAYGSFDSQNYRLRQGGDLGEFDYYLTYDKRESRGHLPNSDYEHDNLSLYLGYDLNDNWEFSLNSKYFDGFNRVPEPSVAGTWKDYQRYSYDFSLEGQTGGIKHKFLAYRNQGHHKFSDGWDAKDYSTGVMVHSEFSPLEGNNFLIGGEFREQAGKIYSDGFIYDPGKYDKNEFAFFLRNEQKVFNDKLILDAGLRYTEDSYSGGKFIPSVGAVWHVTYTTSLRTSISKGFRAPQLNELKFYSFANPDLKPEESWNYEAGFSHKFNPNIEWDFVYFLIEAENFIRNRGGVFQNIRSLDLKGFETSLRYLITSNLSGTLSFSRLDSGRYTKGRPEHKLDLTMRYKKDKIAVSANLQCIDNYYAADDRKDALPNYVLLNTKISYYIKDNLKVSLGIDNVFNSEHKIYADLPGTAAGVYTQPGRTFILRSTYSW